jgi:hypothetical protein
MLKTIDILTANMIATVIIFFLVFLNNNIAMMAIPVRIATITIFGNIRDNTKSNKVKKPMINTFCERPSRYKTNMNEQKTSAEPVSFCNKTKAMGIAIIKPDMNLVLISENLLSMELRYLASAKQVANFANSEG